MGSNGFGPLEFINPPDSLNLGHYNYDEHTRGSPAVSSNFITQTDIYKQHVASSGVTQPTPFSRGSGVGTIPDSYMSQHPAAPAGATFFPPPPGPALWTSPFGAAVAAFGHGDPTAVKGAIAAAAEAETHVRRGIAVAHSWWPDMVHTLRGYFAVSHRSIRQKLFALFFPPFGYRYLWKLKSSGSGSGAYHSAQLSTTNVLDTLDENDSPEKKALYNINHLGPDLYLPLMAFMTYVLLCGLAKGTLNNFHPEVLPATASFASLLTAVEGSSTLLVLYFAGVQHIPFIDILSILGLKFQSLVVIILVGLSLANHTILFWSVFVYCSFCASHATFQLLRNSELQHRPQSEWVNKPPYVSEERRKSIEPHRHDKHARARGARHDREAKPNRISGIAPDDIDDEITDMKDGTIVITDNDIGKIISDSNRHLKTDGSETDIFRFTQTRNIGSEGADTGEAVREKEEMQLKYDETTTQIERKRRVAKLLRAASDSTAPPVLNMGDSTQSDAALTNEQFESIANFRRANVLDSEATILERKAKKFKKLAEGAIIDTTGFPVCDLLKIGPLEFVPTLDEIRHRIDHTVVGQLTGTQFTIFQKKRPKITYDVESIILPVFNIPDSGETCWGFLYHGVDQIFCAANEISRNSWIDSISEAWYCQNEGLQGTLPSVQATEEEMLKKSKIEKPTPAPKLEEPKPQSLVDINLGLDPQGNSVLRVNGIDVHPKTSSI